MNIAIVSGRLVKNAVVRGTETKVLAFTLETKSTDGEKERSTFVPCTLFNPSAKMQTLLTQQGEGVLVELEGRISGPNPDAEKKFGTEVIVWNRSLTILEPAAE